MVMRALARSPICTAAVSYTHLATKNGHDAEVRRDKDGNFVVYSVKKQRADKIQVK